MPNGIDRDALHRLLYRRADRLHRLKLNQKDLAAELGVSYYNFTVIMRSFAKEGRMRAIGGSHFEAKTFVVEDPTHWHKT